MAVLAFKTSVTGYFLTFNYVSEVLSLLFTIITFSFFPFNTQSFKFLCKWNDY